MTKFKMQHRVVTEISTDDVDVYGRIVDLLTENLGPRFVNINAHSYSPHWDEAKRNYNMVRGEDSQWDTAMGEINSSRANNWMCYESTVKAYSGKVHARELVVVVDDDTMAVQLRLMLA
jgi:hypothetical protein